MRNTLLPFLLVFFLGGTALAQDLLPGYQMDEIDGQTIFTCDGEFFDSGGHYINC